MKFIRFLFEEVHDPCYFPLKYPANKGVYRSPQGNFKVQLTMIIKIRIESMIIRHNGTKESTLPGHLQNLFEKCIKKQQDKETKHDVVGSGNVKIPEVEM